MKTYLVAPGRVAALAEMVSRWPAVVLDCETTGLDLYTGDRVMGFAMGSLYPQEEEEYYYLPLAHKDFAMVSPEELKSLWDAVAGKSLLGYNFKFDLHALSPLAGDFPDSKLYDVLVMARILAQKDRPLLSLEIVASQELGYSYVSEAAGHQAQYGKGKYSVHQIGLKCCEDVHCTRLLYLHFKEKLTGRLRQLYGMECLLTRQIGRAHV